MSHRYRELSSDEQIRAALRPYLVEPTSTQVGAIRTYLNSLLLWNVKLNLTSLTDPAEILARHFGESFYCLPFIRHRDGRLADVGSGAGFPGLALKVLLPDLQVTLIESSARKCSFLKEVSRQLGLRTVKILHSRYQDEIMPDASLDFIASRALGGYHDLLRWSFSVLRESGSVLLWLGGKDCTILRRTGAWAWSQPKLLPLSRDRYILRGEKL